MAKKVGSAALTAEAHLALLSRRRARTGKSAAVAIVDSTRGLEDGRGKGERKESRGREKGRGEREGEERGRRVKEGAGGMITGRGEGREKKERWEKEKGWMIEKNLATYQQRRSCKSLYRYSAGVAKSIGSSTRWGRWPRKRIAVRGRE